MLSMINYIPVNNKLNITIKLNIIIIQINYYSMNIIGNLFVIFKFYQIIEIRDKLIIKKIVFIVFMQ